MKKVSDYGYTKDELLDLASDVRKAAYLLFYLGHDDRAPDGDRLAAKGKRMIADALLFMANKMPKEKDASNLE